MREYFYQRDRKSRIQCDECGEWSDRFYVESEMNYETKAIRDYYTPCRKCEPKKFNMQWMWRTNYLTQDQKRRNEMIGSGFEYGAPDRFKDIEIQFLVDNDRVVGDDLNLFLFKYFEDGGNNACFYGVAGTGKTMAAYALCNAIQYELNYPKYVTHSMLKKAIIRGYHEKNDYQILNHYINASILFIDEFGSIQQSENDRSWMFDIIDGRYSKKRPTVLIVNVEKQDAMERLRKELGFRGYDRFQKDMEWYAFSGGSFRR